MDKKWKLRSEIAHTEWKMNFEETSFILESETILSRESEAYEERALQAEADLVECLDMLEDQLRLLKNLQIAGHNYSAVRRSLNNIESLLNKHK